MKACISHLPNVPFLLSWTWNLDHYVIKNPLKVQMKLTEKSWLKPWLQPAQLACPVDLKENTCRNVALSKHAVCWSMLHPAKHTTSYVFLIFAAGQHFCLLLFNATYFFCIIELKLMHACKHSLSGGVYWCCKPTIGTGEKIGIGQVRVA